MIKIKDLQPGVPVILADGSFPKSERVLEYIDKASAIICCDGATLKLLNYGKTPTCIVGDMDSLPKEYQEKYQDIIISSEDQETNDLTKGVFRALEMGLKEAVIIGGTGRREDHTIGNIGLLVEHSQRLRLQMLSDSGVFTPIRESTIFLAEKGQQVSIFGVIGQVYVTYSGLKYPLNNALLNGWWQGTLNEVLDKEFTVEFDEGGVVVFKVF